MACSGIGAISIPNLCLCHEELWSWCILYGCSRAKDGIYLRVLTLTWITCKDLYWAKAKSASYKFWSPITWGSFHPLCSSQESCPQLGWRHVIFRDFILPNLCITDCRCLSVQVSKLILLSSTEWHASRRPDGKRGKIPCRPIFGWCACLNWQLITKMIQTAI